MIDIIKFDELKQFPVDEIINDKDRIVRGWITVEVKDKQGDVVPIDELKRSMNTWFDRGAPIQDTHTNRPVGKGLRWQEAKHPSTGKKGILLDYKIYDDYSIDDQAWEEIKSGKRKGLSIGGRSLTQPKKEKYDGSEEEGNVLRKLELYEVSSVPSPANQWGQNIAVNFLAKGDKPDEEFEYEQKLIKDLQKGYAINKEDAPFAGFDNIGSCIDAQKERGHSSESAQRVCNFLMHNTNKKFVKSQEVQKPFAGYKDFEDCVSQNKDKEDPGAYCATIMRQVEGKEEKGDKKKSDDDQNPDLNKDQDNVEKQLNIKRSNIKKDNIAKSEEVAMKKNETEKQDDSYSDGDEKKPEEDKKPATEARVDKLEKDIGKILKILEKQDEKPEEDKKPEDEKKSAKLKAEDGKPADDEKKPEGMDKKKDITGEKTPLPKAPAGETDETAKPEGDKGDKLVEKDIQKMIDERAEDKIKEVLKSMGIEKTTTPRPTHNIAKNQTEKKSDIAMEWISKAHSGQISTAEMNMQLKELAKTDYDQRVSQILNAEVQ